MPYFWAEVRKYRTQESVHKTRLTSICQLPTAKEKKNNQEES